MFLRCGATTRLRSIRTLAMPGLNQGISPKYDAVQNLLKEHARLIRLVEMRIDERAKLQSEVLSSLMVWRPVLLTTSCSFQMKCLLQRK